MTLTLVEIGENNINNINGNDSEEMEGNGGLYCNGSIGNGHILVDDSKPGKTTVISSTDPHEHLLDRVKQTGAMLFYLFTFLLAPGYIAAAFLAMAFCPFFWPFLLLYLAWFIYDFKAPCRGSRSNDAIHNWSLWRNVANYYPIEVHKTADIPPDRNYVFASHPHGVFATGTFILLGCGAHNFRKLFPGIKMHIVTLPMNFWFPLRREFYLLFGNMISSHVEALEYVLDSEGKGNAIGIVPGGAAEALHAFPRMNRLVLAKRKGFVRLAIKYGAYLVPVYNFGENDVLEQLPNPEGSFIRKLQECGKQLMGFSLPLCYGQNTVASVLPKSWLEKLPRFLTIGLLPFRRKIVTVVGEPLPVPKDPNPSRELVNRVHAEYCAKLEELFNKYKSSLGGLPDSAKLEFV